MADIETWRDYARQAQQVADLRAELRASDARCAQLLEACGKLKTINDDLLVAHNKLKVQFDILMKSQLESIDCIKADTAAFNDIAERSRAKIAAVEAKEATEEKPAA
jgi:hypothetical protein